MSKVVSVMKKDDVKKYLKELTETEKEIFDIFNQIREDEKGE